MTLLKGVPKTGVYVCGKAIAGNAGAHTISGNSCLAIPRPSY
jgi:hypothetical protein